MKKKFFTEERIDAICDVLFDISIGFGPMLMVVIPIIYDALFK